VEKGDIISSGQVAMVATTRSFLLVVLLGAVTIGCAGEPVLSPTPVVAPIRTPFDQTLPTPTPTAVPVATSSPSVPDWIAHQEIAMTEAAKSDVSELDHLTRYDIDVTIGMESLSLTGRQQTQYTNSGTVALEELYFNLFPNSSRFAASMDIEAASIAGQEVPFDYELGRTAAKVVLPKRLLPGEAITVTLDFAARVPHVQENYYLVFVYAQGVLSLGDWHPMVAVYDDEGWNLEFPEGNIGEIVYGESAFYTVRLTLPEGPSVVATGVEAERMLNADGTQTLVYYSGPVRDFHIVVSDRYEVASGMVGGTMINSYYWPEHEACGVKILWFANLALNLYSQFFGPYPFNELDLVEADLWPWAIEWPGFILVGEPLYSDPQEACGEWHVVHEVAHQWWYSVVGNDQVDEPWLDEALANYSTALYHRMVYDPETAEAEISEHINERYEAYVQAYGDGIVGGSTRDYTRASYYPLVYGKGALFFEALQELIGDEAFFQGLQRYYREYKYDVATAEGLLDIMELTYGQPLDEFYEHWILRAEGI